MKSKEKRKYFKKFEEGGGWEIFSFPQNAAFSSKYGSLLKKVCREAKLNVDLLEYQTGKQAIRDCREFVNLVVLYRERDQRKCLVY